VRAILLAFWALSIFAQDTVFQHMILFESSGTDLSVSETFMAEGGGKFQVALPKDATLAGTRGGTAVKDARTGIYSVTVAGQQGQESRFDINWTMPFVVPEELSGRILHSGPVRMVFPKDVKASGTMLESNGVEPTTQSSIYTLKGKTYKIMIDGAGTLRSQRPQGQPEEEQGPRIEQILPRIYDRKYLVLGLTAAILVIGFILNYRASIKE